MQSMKKEIENCIKNIPDFPKEGIQFKDITPLFKNIDLFDKYITYYATQLKNKNITKIVCVDARGFIFGTALAMKLGLPFVLARKQGKLPDKTLVSTYNLEYGTSTLEMHVADINDNDNVLIVDDLLATGGTVEAVSKLVQNLGGKIHGYFFLIELTFLEGKVKLTNVCKNDNINFYTLIKY